MIRMITDLSTGLIKKNRKGTAARINGEKPQKSGHDHEIPLIPTKTHCIP